MNIIERLFSKSRTQSLEDEVRSLRERLGALELSSYTLQGAWKSAEAGIDLQIDRVKRELGSISRLKREVDNAVPDCAEKLELVDGKIRREPFAGGRHGT